MVRIPGQDRECTATQTEFQERMKAQCKQIERYRLYVLCNEGRHLSQDEAAMEWITCYAQDFVQGNDAA